MAEYIADPVFNPQNPAESVDQLESLMPASQRWLEGSLVGDAISSRRGHGMEIVGMRPYEYGDDLRRVDQAVTARDPQNWPQIRQYRDEVAPHLWIVTDALQSRSAVTPGYYSEQNLALGSLMALMRAAHLQNMPTALVAVNDERTLQLDREPRNGRKHLYDTAIRLGELIAPSLEIDASDASTKRSLFRRQPRLTVPAVPAAHFSDALQLVGQRAQGNIVALVSDFRDVVSPEDPAHGWLRLLEGLRQRRNELIAIETTNAYDFALPDAVTRFMVPGGVRWLGTDKASVRDRQAYAAAAVKQQEAIDSALSSVKAKHIKLATDDAQWLSTFRTQLLTPRS